MSAEAMRLVVVALIAACASPAGAQPTRVDVPRGEVTGLEMGIDGSLVAVPGGRLRWFVTVFEVVRRRDLRPSPQTALRVLASHHRAAPVAEAMTDAGGRAALEVEIPPTLGGSVDLVVEARSPRGVMRRFEVTAQVGARYAVDVFVDRGRVPPGGSVRAFGRVIDRATGGPAAGAEVRLSLGGLRADARTDARGAFDAEITVGAAETAGPVVASVGSTEARSRPVLVRASRAPALVVAAVPARRLVRPGARTDVDVVVRTPDGRPVPHARLSGLSIPVPEEPGEVVEVFETDARGRARVPWRVALPGTGPAVAEIEGELRAVRAGLGEGSTRVHVRAARGDTIVEHAVEGGALVVGAPSRVFVRVLGVDGRPRPDVEVSLASERFEAAPARTDARGVAVLEGTLVDGVDETCGGATATALHLRAGSETADPCVPVDPDATLRVRAAPLSWAGRPVEVRVTRIGAVARLPVAVTALIRDGDRLVPVASSMLSAAEDRGALTLPREAVGEVWLRARPVLADGREVRGGGALTLVAPREPHTTDLRAEPSGRVELTVQGGGDAEVTGFALAVPAAAGRALLARLRGSLGPLGEIDAGATEASILAALAARTPHDHAAAAVLREGAVEAVGVPGDPVRLGLLRDPVRARTRFVRGRLGLLMRAVEAHVAASLPGRRDDVAVRDGGRWRFNRELLATVGAELGAESVQGLDGSPLDVDALTALDSAFDYDHVARRITRERLMRVLVALTRFVRQRGLDYAWARRGDPGTWLSALLSWEDPESYEALDPESLHDGWGQPFELRPARGGRARFRFLEPVEGWEVVSVGPDGRAGTSDDVVDPFARVLPSGGVYAEAVGEDILLARLSGVELGRATVAALGEVFEVEPPLWVDADVASVDRTWGTGPAPLPEDGPTLDVEARGPLVASLGAVRPMPPQGADIAVALGAEPRRYDVVAGSFTREGGASFARAPLRAGVPMAFEATLPTRVTVGEELRVPIRLTWLDPRRELRVEVVGRGAVEARLARPEAARFALDAGQARRLELVVRGADPGEGSLAVRVRDAAGVVLRESTGRVQVAAPGALRAQHTGRFVRGEATARLELPDDARPIEAFLVVTGPRAVRRDPGLEAVRRAHPALFAWAAAVAGEAPDDATLAALRPGPEGMLATPVETACAIVAWSAVQGEPTDPRWQEAQRARAAAATALWRAAPTSAEERAAVLVALSAAATGWSPESAGVDPVEALVASLRETAWRGLWRQSDRPTVLARLAAGLLLAHREDDAGRELIERAQAHTEAGPRGGLTLPGDGGSGADATGYVGTLALALAARQLGRDDLADELARGLAPRLYLSGRGGPRDAFWLLAASAFGAFGAEAPDAVAVDVAGRPRRVPLADGVARVPLPAQGGRVAVRSEAPVLARLEARYVRAEAARPGAPLRVRVSGDPGFAGETAAFEVTVDNEGTERFDRPVLEIALPGAARLTEVARRALERAPGVRRVEDPDARGVVRVHLHEIRGGSSLRVPLPVRWIGAGRTRGLGLVIYDAGRPWVSSSTEPIDFDLRPRPRERW